MPIYEYECNACHEHLEVTQSMKDAPLKTCAACGKDELQKLISRSAFHLKGGGWYSDLYSSTSKEKPEVKKTETTTATTTGAPTSEKSTSTPAAAAPAAASTPAPASTTSSGSEKKAEGRPAAA